MQIDNKIIFIYYVYIVLNRFSKGTYYNLIILNVKKIVKKWPINIFLLKRN